MNRSGRLTVLILILCIGGDSYAALTVRHQWWQARLGRLTAERTRLARSPGADPRIAALVEEEIRRARGIIDVFESDLKQDGSLTHETRTVSVAEIAAEADAAATAYCALKQLELATRAARSDGADEALRGIVKERLAGIVSAPLARDGEEAGRVAESIMREDILPDTWKAVAVETALGRLMEDGDAFVERCRAATAGAVTRALAAQSNLTNDRELRALAMMSARDFAGSYAPPPGGTGPALEKSHSWRSVESSLKRELQSWSTIIALMPGRTTPLDRVRRLAKSPDELEALLFREMKESVGGGASPHRLDRNARAGGDLEVPALPDIPAVLDEMHRVRRALVLSVSGREDRRFLDDTKARLAALVVRHTDEARRQFAREEEKLARRTAAGAPPPRNEQEFRGAQRAFEAAAARLAACVEPSVAVIALASSSKRIESGQIVSSCRYRARRDRDYLEFLAGVVSSCEGLSVADDPGAAQRFAEAFARTDLLFSFAGTSPMPDSRALPFLSRQDRSLIRELDAGFSAAVRSVRIAMTASHDRFVKAAAAGARLEKQTQEGLDEKIAQEDIDAQIGYARKCADLHGRYLYADSALERYGACFEQFAAQARSGAVSPALRRAAEAGSIIPFVADFDTGRIRAELDAKRYLRSEIEGALSRLATLVQLYRRRGVLLRDVPTAGELASIRGRLDAPPRVRIDAWTMCESNVAEIDANAARRLSQLLGRAAPAGEKPGPASAAVTAGEGTVVTIDGPGLTFSVPRCWEEQEIGETERYQGIVRSFHDGAGASLKVVRLPLENRDAKETAEEWIRKGGCNPVEKRWRKAHDLDCLMILASDRKRMVTQTCAIEREGFAILITGSAARDRYPSFRTRFMKIIDSVQAGKL